MAKIGVRYPKYCPYTVTQNADGTETETLGTGKVMGKAMGIDTTINADAVDQFADDGIAENTSEFTGGTIKNELNDLIDSAAAEILGSTITDGELISNSDDNAPYMRHGFIVPKVLNNVKLYRAITYMRVKYAPPSESFNTKGKSIAFGSTTISGTIMRNKDKQWKREKTFDTEAAALAYLNEKMNITGTHDALTLTPVPANNATAVAVGSAITLTFNNPIDHGNAALINATTDAVVQSTKAFNGGKTVLTITPTSALTAATKYAVVVAGMADAYGQSLPDTVIKFTTA